ncbi:NUDIX domain-containing protein [Paenibacillus sp. N3.4]|uniref:NUDIX domain-containing protein n=1 Tax=Paenibacillus sp. N3.4 TaxID=2603222 RepID=UPI0028FCE07E|nr:NUDIX domain-containing protein [Paenibacillus sp. N3.4]
MTKFLWSKKTKHLLKISGTSPLNILDAARRETKEETGYNVKLTGTTGIYNFISSSNHQVILFHFLGEIIGGSLQLDTSEIIDSMWISPLDLLVPNFELRDKELIKQIVENLMSEEKENSLTLFNSYLKSRL